MLRTGAPAAPRLQVLHSAGEGHGVVERMGMEREWPIEIVDLPIKNGDFTMRNVDFPIRNGDFPIKHGDFPIKKCDFTH